MSLMFRKAERYYHVYIQQNFFGGVTVICRWGTFDSNRGGYKYHYCKNMLEANQELEIIKKTRKIRGYEPYYNIAIAEPTLT